MARTAGTTVPSPSLMKSVPPTESTLPSLLASNTEKSRRPPVSVLNCRSQLWPPALHGSVDGMTVVGYLPPNAIIVRIDGS